MIRLGTPDDLPRLIEVSLASFDTVTWQRSVDSIFGPLNGLDWRERWHRRVERAMQEETFLVLVEDDRIAGYACGTVDRASGLGHLDILAVDPACQGKGHGRQLLHAFEDWLRSQGAGHLTFESLTDNDAANHLYLEEGFQALASHYNWFKKI